MVESSALLKRRTSKGYRGFESLPHRQIPDSANRSLSQHPALSRTGDSNSFDCPCLQSLQGVEATSISGQHYCSTSRARNPSLTVFIGCWMLDVERWMLFPSNSAKTNAKVWITPPPQSTPRFPGQSSAIPAPAIKIDIERLKKPRRLPEFSGAGNRFRLCPSPATSSARATLRPSLPVK